jgi:hypothetical protein
MKNYKIIFLIGLQGLLSSCSENRNETVNEYRAQLKDNYQVLITRKVTKTEHRGALTNNNYGSTLSIAYGLKIKDKNRTLVDSNLGGEEPKHLLICPNETLLRVVGEYYSKQQDAKKEEPNKENINEYKVEIRASYKKLIDERYFFNLLGEAFWVVDEENSYTTLVANNSDCSEYSLPNDNIYNDNR